MLNVEQLAGVFAETETKRQSSDQLFNQLVERYTSYLYRYAYWRCQNRALAEDLVQETFARAWRRLNSLRDITVAKSWLTTILRREHARLFERRQIDIIAETQPEDLTDTVDHDAEAETIELRMALAKLPQKYREPLVLQVLGGYNCEEIAAMLDLSKSAVMTRVFRAREKLKCSLSVNDEDTHR